jgi:hypothetical protein
MHDPELAHVWPNHKQAPTHPPKSQVRKRNSRVTGVWIVCAMAYAQV